MKLAFKIGFLCLLMTAITLCCLSYFNIRREATDFQEDHERFAAELALALQPLMMDAWQQGGHAELEATARGCSRALHFVEVRYIRLDVPSSSTGTTVPLQQIAELNGRGRPLTVTFANGEGARTVRSYVPLGLANVRGGLEVSRTMEEVEERVLETMGVSLLSLLSACVLCAGVIVLGGIRMIGRPLDRLIEKTQRIGRGDLSGPLELRSAAELNQLATALNEMCEQLSSQQARIAAETASRSLAEQRLRHADRLNSVGRLAAGVAHEMGTPLNVISGRAGLIAAGRLSSEETRQSAATIKAEADRITEVIRELLDFARHSTPQRTWNDLRDVVRQTVDLLKFAAAKQHTDVHVRADEGDYQAYVDAGQLQQVFTNIIVNALQSITEGGQVDISLRAENAIPPREVDAAAAPTFASIFGIMVPGFRWPCVSKSLNLFSPQKRLATGRAWGFRFLTESFVSMMVGLR